MDVRRGLAKGWAEAGVGLLWIALSLLGFADGNHSVPGLTWDLVIFAALLVVLRWQHAGAVLICAVTLAGLWADPRGLGVGLYISACAVTLLVHHGRPRLAALTSLVLMISMAIIMQRRTADWGDYLAAQIGPAIVIAVAWLIGLGFRWVARVEAERVSKEYVERQMRMAVDIHDFVGRNLAGLLVRADKATGEERAQPEFLKELVARVQNADDTLREVTADLQREGSAKPFRAVSADNAVRAGVAELEASGFEVQGGDVDVALAGLPSQVDLVVSRVIAEALHNVVRHGEKSQPCQIEVVRTDEVLNVVIKNTVKPRAAQPLGRLGLVGMGRHARLAGGTVQSEAGGVIWTFRLTLPLVRLRQVPAREAAS